MKLGVIPPEIGSPERQLEGNGPEPALAPHQQSRFVRVAGRLPPEDIPPE